MENLQQMRKELDQLKYFLNSFHIFLETFPPHMIGTDLRSLIDDVNYVCGYIECMVTHQISLP